MSQFHDLIEQQAEQVFCNPDLFGAAAGSVVYVPPTGPAVTVEFACVLTDEDLTEILAVAVPEYGRDGQQLRHFAAVEVPAELSVDFERGAFRLSGDRYEILKQVGKDFGLQTLLLERTERSNIAPGSLRK